MLHYPKNNAPTAVTDALDIAIGAALEQFTSQLWFSIHQLLGIRLHHATAYHPKANGLVERFHRQPKTALMTRLTSANWIDELPWFCSEFTERLKRI